MDVKQEGRRTRRDRDDPPKVIPGVTAVILNWCGEAVTTECLRSLQHSEYQNLTVLLVDNGSPDGSGDRLRRAFPDIEYLQTGHNLGYVGGNNRGIGWALDRGANYARVLHHCSLPEMSTRFAAGGFVHPHVPHLRSPIPPSGLGSSRS